MGETLGITQVPPAAFEFALQDFIACENSFNAYRSAKQTASSACLNAVEALAQWLAVTRNVLAGHFGNRWSPLWAQAGFNDNSTAVPAPVAGKLALALALNTFFTAHATWQVPELLVTAARAATLRTAALAAQQALATIEVNMGGQWDLRLASRKALVGLIRTVIAVLKRTLEPLDPRWTAFGLNKPGADTTPGQPGNVLVSVDAATGKILVQCDPVPLAQRYRWRMRVAGVETAYELAASSVPPQALLDPVAAGAVVEIIVQAVNGGTQGVASAPVLFAMPAAAVALTRWEALEPAPERALIEGGERKGNEKGFHLRTT